MRMELSRMMSKKKFLGLKPITQIFKICNELELQRDNFISSKNVNLDTILNFSTYLAESEKDYISNKLQSIIYEKDKRLQLEKIHFLLHELREEVGYPISEKQFIKSSKDKIFSNDIVKNNLIVILENLRSAFNVGSIIRSAECFGIKEVIATGITPKITDKKVIKTAKGTDKNIDFSYDEDIVKVIKRLKENNYTVIGAETGDGSMNLIDYKFETKTAVIFGNEEIGLTQSAIELCDTMVEIDMKGLKNSLNVSNAASIFMFEYNRQF